MHLQEFRYKFVHFNRSMKCPTVGKVKLNITKINKYQKVKFKLLFVHERYAYSLCIAQNNIIYI